MRAFRKLKLSHHLLVRGEDNRLLIMVIQSVTNEK
jgi:hypothetical protein